MLYCTEYRSTLGRLTLASNGGSLAGLWIEGQKYFGGELGRMAPKADLPVFEQVRAWLDRYFAGEKPSPTELPLAPAGGEFRQTVWKLLCRIPYGQVTTYGALAKAAAEELGRASMSAQAVGGAVGRNPISIIIPCHRVVGAGGSLTGYAGGIDRKIQLLRLEGADLSGLTRPKKGTAL